MVVSEYSNGFKVALGSRFNLNQNVDRKQSKRGNVIYFSSKSCARLRDILLKLDVSGKQVWALTLTVPGNLTPVDWRALLERFRTRLIRLHLGLVWRVELQRRGVPHLHCVLLCDKIDDVFEVWNAWISSGDSVYEGCVWNGKSFACVPWSCHRGFLYYGFSCRRVSGAGWYGYVASHCAKHKSSQLGWFGRQWGIINKSALSFESSRASTHEDYGFLIFVCRCIRKRWRFSTIHINKKGTYDFFCSSNFIEKCKAWYYRDLPF